MSGEGRKTRKELLLAAGAVAGAATVGQLVGTETAAAADGGSLVLGAANMATNRTSLATSGAIANDGALSVSAAAADYGIYGSGASYGVVGSGPGGVLGLGTVGGVFSGSVVAINLVPQDAVGAPLGQAFKGDLTVDAAGVLWLWLCIAAGTPGTWIKASHGGTRYLDTPQRAYDSRTSGAGKLRPGFGDTGNPRVIPIGGVTHGVPTNAVGIVGNLTVTQEDSGGFATIWPSGPWPGTSNINFSSVDLANAFTVGLDAGGNVSIAASGTTHVIIDVAGYVL